MLKIAFIRTKVEYFLACLTLRACRKFYKVIQIWPLLFLVSEQMPQEAKGNEKEGYRKKWAGGLAMPPCLSDNSCSTKLSMLQLATLHSPE